LPADSKVVQNRSTVYEDVKSHGGPVNTFSWSLSENFKKNFFKWRILAQGYFVFLSDGGALKRRGVLDNLPLPCLSRRT